MTINDFDTLMEESVDALIADADRVMAKWGQARQFDDSARVQAAILATVLAHVRKGGTCYELLAQVSQDAEEILDAVLAGHAATK